MQTNEQMLMDITLDASTQLFQKQLALDIQSIKWYHACGSCFFGILQKLSVW